MSQQISIFHSALQIVDIIDVNGSQFGTDVERILSGTNTCEAKIFPFKADNTKLTEIPLIDAGVSHSENRICWVGVETDIFNWLVCQQMASINIIFVQKTNSTITKDCCVVVFPWNTNILVCLVLFQKSWCYERWLPFFCIYNHNISSQCSHKKGIITIETVWQRQILNIDILLLFKFKFWVDFRRIKMPNF